MIAPMRIGRYQVVRELGSGAMGVVYAATDPLIGRTVAIKTIHLQGPSLSGQTDSLRLRLRREAQSAGVLSHPGIVTIHDIFEEGEDAFIVMEYVDGTTMEEILASKVPQHTGLLIKVLRKTAEALDYAHAKGIVHRDIKPSNLMLCRDGSVKITDFGVAKVSDSPSLTQTGLVMGTPNYMSPEQARGNEVDGRSDQFSLAVVAYRMLAGALPFDGPTLTAVLTQILLEEPRFSATGLAPSVQAVLKRALAKQAEERYDSCSDFALALEQAFFAPHSSTDSDTETEVPSAAVTRQPVPLASSPATAPMPSLSSPSQEIMASVPPAGVTPPPQTGPGIPIGLDLGEDEGARATEGVGPRVTGTARLRGKRALMMYAAIALLALVSIVGYLLWPSGTNENAGFSSQAVGPEADPQLNLAAPPPVGQTAAGTAVAQPPDTPDTTAAVKSPPRNPSRTASKPVRSTRAPAPAQEQTSLPPAAAAPETEPPPKPPATEPASGVVSWTGRMPRNSLLVIDGSKASFGTLTGALPGVPVEIQVDPPDLVVRERPREQNGWKLLMLYSPTRTVSSITIRWRHAGGGR